MQLDRLSVFVTAVFVALSVPTVSGAQNAVFRSLSPCRIADTRVAGGAIAGGETRFFNVVGESLDYSSQGGSASGCGVLGFTSGKPQVAAVELRVTAVTPSGAGVLRAFPGDAAIPAAGGAVVNFTNTDPALAFNTGVVLAVRQDAAGNDIKLLATKSTHVTIDVVGYLVHHAVRTDVVPDAAAVTGTPNVVGGFEGNIVEAGVKGATIGGGGQLNDESGIFRPNRVTADFGTVGGGRNNQAGGDDPTVLSTFATVGGGRNNIASDVAAVVGGGQANLASATQATVAGGAVNKATGIRSTVAGGVGNLASGGLSTVGGGSDNEAIGTESTVPGGATNSAGGDFSFAAGRHAIVDPAHDGAFLYADSTLANFNSIAADEFAVRASGGFRFRTKSDLSTGCNLPANSGAFSCTSDRATKTAVADVEPREVLHALVAMPIATWRYQGEKASTRHIGPMAQDFAAAFRLGTDDRSIGMLDEGGVALASIQGLYEVVAKQEKRIRALERQNAQLKRRRATTRAARAPRLRASYRP